MRVGRTRIYNYGDGTVGLENSKDMKENKDKADKRSGIYSSFGSSTPTVSYYLCNAIEDVGDGDYKKKFMVVMCELFC